MRKINIRAGLCGLLTAAVASVAPAQEAPPSFAPSPPAPRPPVTAPVVISNTRPGLASGVGFVPNPARALAALPQWPSDASALNTNVVQPFMHGPGTEAEQIARINAVVDRAAALGTVAPNYQRIADTLEKGFPNIMGFESLGYLAKRKVGDPNIRLAGNEPNAAQGQDNKDPFPNNPNPNGNGNGQDNGLKQTVDEINKIFKAQADLIRSLDIGSVRRGDGVIGGVPANGDGNVSRVVLGGRTGLELGPVAPEVLDHFQIPREQGLLIRNVFPDTPAAAAGYKKGDILLEFNNRKVPSNLSDFIERVMDSVKNGVPVPATVLRGAERVKVGDMKITDRRVVPPLPNERQPDLTSIIRVVPGINSDQPSTNNIPEYRIIRDGLITEVVPFYPNKK